jgi:hypothetical protein
MNHCPLPMRPFQQISSPDDVRLWVTPEDLNVDPALLGLPLAAPGRRLMAMAVDLAAIGVLSSLFSIWLLGAVVLAIGERAWTARHGPSRVRRAAVGLLALGLLGLAVQDLRLSREQAARDSVLEAAAERALEAAPAASETASKTASEKASSRASGPASGSTPAAPAGPRDRADAATAAALAAQVATLEAELAEARSGMPQTLQSQWARWRAALDELGLGYGWALAYFSLLPAWLGGQTPGKRLLRLRVVELTGKPMTALRNLKRFGGYAAGMATGGLGFAQLLWDSNRQAIQDKTAHTVVVDLRRARRAEQAA